MTMFNHDFDPYTELLRTQAEVAECRAEVIRLQQQLHQTLQLQNEIVRALNNQAQAIQHLQQPFYPPK